jgi:hypothetical protein
MSTSFCLAFAVFCRSLAKMKILRHLGLLGAVLFSPTGISASDGVLTVRASEAIVEIQPGDALRNQLALPALDVTLLATFNCQNGNKAASLTVSISDTYQYYGPDLLGDAASFEATFNVPANQLAPVSVPGFCVLGQPAGNRSMLLPGIATAQASLRCGGDDGTASVHFHSVSVPVTLYCVEEDNSDSLPLAK